MALINSSSFTYDVFLSFRGADTRLGFTGSLYHALDEKGVHTFIDHEKLKSGEEITPALEKAIQESRIAIIVLSTNYATSSFCLDELAYILEWRERKTVLVLPVFYEVEPSDVRHQKGSYGEALAKHEKRLKHNSHKLQKWKTALQQVSNFSGYHFKQGSEYDYKFIASIVDRVFEEINHFTRLSLPDHPVGLEPQKAKVMELLDVGSSDGVHMVGIHGMGGVGKSTLAQAVYKDLIAKKFDGSCYLENVKEKSKIDGLAQIQKVLLQEILRDKKINITSWKQGASMIPQRLQRKKVLLLVDDLDNIDQLKAIVGSPDWFGPGSRVIITTRDKHLLTYHEVKQTYEVKEMNETNALQLLTWNAFKKEKADPTYEEVLNRLLTYASGLPLALEVIGASLFGKSIEEWRSAIDQYERIPHTKIQDVLKVSFDDLQVDEKNVFLDIACCLKGLIGAEEILDAHYGRSMKYHIGVLVEKSLIKVSYGTITVHDLIEDMGKEIVRQESTEEPEERSRLWSKDDIIKVLEGSNGTRKIKIIYLDFPKSDNEEIIKWDGNAFKEMKNLKILIIKNGIFSEGAKFLPNSLRVLEWRRYPSHCLPSDFQPGNLVICKLTSGCITSFELDPLSKTFVNVTVLKFDECKFLTHVPDVSGLPNLKELSFQECVNLVSVHKSIGFLEKLENLDFFKCCKLGSFPPIWLPSLEFLELRHCSNLTNFPEILGEMGNMREVLLGDTSIRELPSSFQYITGTLEYFSHDALIYQWNTVMD